MATAPTVVTVSSGYFSAETMNANFTVLADAFEDVLSLSGTTPNSMSADLDMNSQDIINVADLSCTGLTVNGVAVTVSAFTATTTELADVSDAINTSNKAIGKMVFNTTTGAPVWAVGTAAASVWNDATGSTAHTPV